MSQADAISEAAKAVAENEAHTNVEDKNNVQSGEEKENENDSWEEVSANSGDVAADGSDTSDSNSGADSVAGAESETDALKAEAEAAA